MKECPFAVSQHGSRRECDDSCALYTNDCIIKRALECYINEHTPMETYNPELYEMLINTKPSIPTFMRDDCQSINDIPF